MRAAIAHQLRGEQFRAALADEIEHDMGTTAGDVLHLLLDLVVAGGEHHVVGAEFAGEFERLLAKMERLL